MPLDLKSLSDSINALRASIETANAYDESSDEKLRDTIRSGVIQSFEVAYEMSWKMIQRWVKKNISPEDAEHPRTRKELFRLAAQKGLIDDPLPWFGYGESRNETSHTYNQEKARSVYEISLLFLVDVERFYQRLETMND